MIKTADYQLLLKCRQQLTILLKSEYVNDHVNDAVLEINNIKESTIDLDDYDEEKLITAVDVEILLEHDDSLYKLNPFYIEFAEISDNVKNYQYNEKTKQENVYYNPEFLTKFLVRFVPLIAFWTNVLSYQSKTSDQPPPLSVLEAVHNQPIENYFGFYKSDLGHCSNQLGKLPTKMGRAIIHNQNMMTPTIKAVDCLIARSD